MADFFEKNNMSTTRNTHSRSRSTLLHSKKCLGSLTEVFKNLKYDDWASLKMMKDDQAARIITDEVMLTKFKKLIRDLPKNGARAVSVKKSIHGQWTGAHADY